jgi:hypothetical protein
MKIEHPYNPTPMECNGCSKQMTRPEDGVSVCISYGWPSAWFRHNIQGCPLGDHYPKEAPKKKAFVNPLKLAKQQSKGLA